MSGSASQFYCARKMMKQQFSFPICWCKSDYWNAPSYDYPSQSNSEDSVHCIVPFTDQDQCCVSMPALVANFRSPPSTQITGFCIESDNVNNCKFIIFLGNYTFILQTLGDEYIILRQNKDITTFDIKLCNLCGGCSKGQCKVMMSREAHFCSQCPRGFCGKINPVSTLNAEFLIRLMGESL